MTRIMRAGLYRSAFLGAGPAKAKGALWARLARRIIVATDARACLESATRATITAMADSSFDPQRLRQARALLAAPPTASAGLGGLAAAAAFFAISALALAAAVVMTPTPWPT
jgi:hypothetical protein